MFPSLSEFRICHFPRRMAALTQSPLRPDFPVLIELELTRHTNLELSGTRKKRPPVIDLSKEAAISYLRQMAALSSVGVHFGGRGEVSLHGDASELIKAAREMQLEVGVETNGLHLPKPLLESIVRFSNVCVVKVDAPKAKDYAAMYGVAVEDWHSVMENCVALANYRNGKRARVKLAARLLINDFTVRSVQGWAEDMQSIGFDAIHILCPQSHLHNLLKLPLLALDSETFRIEIDTFPSSIAYSGPCYCMAFLAFISSDRLVYACRKRIEKDSPLGTLEEHLLSTIILSEERRRLLKTASVEDCQDCPALKLNKFISQVLESNGLWKHFILEPWKL